jgi:hypothetical protein
MGEGKHCFVEFCIVNIFNSLVQQALMSLPGRSLLSVITTIHNRTNFLCPPKKTRGSILSVVSVRLSFRP